MDVNLDELYRFSELSENMLFFDPTGRQTIGVGFEDRKSYRDVASISQKTVHNSQKVNDLSNVTTNIKSVGTVIISC